MLAKYPNFLLVGAAKSGTTSLYHYLNQHPDIFMSRVKEPLFFCSYGTPEEVLEKEVYPFPVKDIVSDPQDYSRLFSDVTREKAIGEASVYYLLDHEKTISNIKKLVSDWRDMKIIIVLRNPVEASYSNYLMYNQFLTFVMNQKDLPSFEESFKLEHERIKGGYLALAHFHWFLYFQQVKSYLDNFANVKVFLHSDLKQDMPGMIREVFDFLGVDNQFSPSLAGHKYNVSGVPSSGVIYRFLIAPSAIKKILKPLVNFFLSRERKEKLVHTLINRGMTKPAMTPEMRESLTEFYHDDILKLQGLIGRDLSDWLK